VNLSAPNPVASLSPDENMCSCVSTSRVQHVIPVARQRLQSACLLVLVTFPSSVDSPFLSLPPPQEPLGSCGIASGSWCLMKVQPLIPPSQRRRERTSRKASGSRPSSRSRSVRSIESYDRNQTPEHRIINMRTRLSVDLNEEKLKRKNNARVLRKLVWMKLQRVLNIVRSHF